MFCPEFSAYSARLKIRDVTALITSQTAVPDLSSKKGRASSRKPARYLKFDHCSTDVSPQCSRSVRAIGVTLAELRLTTTSTT